jgi:hypothetical protein
MAITNKSLLAQYKATIKEIKNMSNDEEMKGEIEWEILVKAFKEGSENLRKEIIKRGLKIPR